MFPILSIAKKWAACSVLAGRSGKRSHGDWRALSRKYSLYMRTVRRILVTGDRHWNCTDLAERVVNRLIGNTGNRRLRSE
jgi:hypothetical protein